jgi:hypothetical protein
MNLIRIITPTSIMIALDALHSDRINDVVKTHACTSIKDFPLGHPYKTPCG